MSTNATPANVGSNDGLGILVNEGKGVGMLDSHDVRRMVAAKLEGMTQSKVAAELGISCSYLNDYLHFRREPGPTMLEALGLRRVSMYERTSDGSANAAA